MVELGVTLPFAADTLEWPTVLFCIHESSGFAVSLDPSLGLGVVDLTAILHFPSAIVVARVSCH